MPLTRRDKRGRRIGYNWWREYNVSLLRDHNDAADVLQGMNHQMEPEEARIAYPYVTFKACLLANAGMSRTP